VEREPGNVVDFLGFLTSERATQSEECWGETFYWSDEFGRVASGGRRREVKGRKLKIGGKKTTFALGGVQKGGRSHRQLVGG